MQFFIDFIRERSVLPSKRITGSNPSVFEGIEPLPSALGTGSVTCGKRHGFVQEEQFCVTARRHHGTSPALKFQETGNPTPARVLANDLALLIVHRPAPVAHERSASGREKIVPQGSTRFCNGIPEFQHIIARLDGFEPSSEPK
jgi:hypothetical protein